MKLNLFFYLVDRLDAIEILLGVIMTISILGFVILGIIKLGDIIEEWLDEDIRPDFKKLFKISRIAMYISVSLFILTPSSSQCYKYFIVDKVETYIGSNETIQKLPDKLTIALDKILDEYTEKYSEDDKSSK